VTPTRDEARTLAQVFRAPALVAVASTVGLVSALVGDGLWDAVSWLGLGVALVLSVRHGFAWRWPRRLPDQAGR
jgi:hypothetical protein